MEGINENRFNRRIIYNLNNLEKSVKDDFDRICNLFDKVSILGGFTRDSILQVLYNYDFPVNDLDILVEDKNFKDKIRDNFSQENMSRFGGLKLKYNQFEIDVFGLENIFFFNENPLAEKNLSNILKGVDLTTSALAYDLHKNKIYSFGAIEDIYKREINLLNDNGIVVPTICRFILHSDKMNFKIGESGLNYIKKNYSPKLDSEIKDFLDYKNISHLFHFVKSQLNSILR